MVESSKQVRVDNWGIFFLQRLQMFFSKTDYCDLTLQFEGNVQLKVHRLVMNACTEYFTFLEQTCPAEEESTIIMPSDLQADVVVPIVNFMYTGMLEFHMSIFDKLYNAAELMNITILTKLLDAQKTTPHAFKAGKKKTEIPPNWSSQGKKNPTKTSNTPELPATLPGRKLPIWKRKTVPMQHPSSQLHFSDQKWTQDPLSLPDNTPKPTRFEWPDDDLPPINLMDTTFEDISYTSKPLLTQQEEVRASTSFDEVRNNANSHKKAIVKSITGTINIKEVEDYVKEQKVRADFEGDIAEGEYNEASQNKRKHDQNSTKSSPKRMKPNDKENKETTISVKSSNGTDLDHTKIVSEILKKYPHLIKKNKNIRLKIMASGNKNVPEEKISSPVKTLHSKEPVGAAIKSKPKIKPEKPTFSSEGPWTCHKCAETGESQEFVLYYLYRKHMTDIHCEVFDIRLCKYCGRKCGKHSLMMYHLYTKHGLKPPTSYNFPKCNQCPFIALSAMKLDQHKLNHDSDEMQCFDCELAFTNQQTLATHVQITGHFNKAGKSSYDCQYCAKKLQSAINLFSHIKNSHLKEARRDGIVSIDELDDVEDMDEEDENQEDEEAKYIVPDILVPTAMHKDKVKIISNVKVPLRSDQRPDEAEPQTVTLEPSSEAEALNNVASGIATSLGLVDIVVLDENQQYILQQQETQGGQPEYILPELSTGENPFTGQIVTTQHNTVLPQGMLQSSNSDIGSTDELVMVLTDHDYQDEQEGGTTDNSNIVVLYSHPVDGQQGQFITSQGNLLVNSQTGMLEIRNGTTITTSSGQMVVNNQEETPIESIEMIQREIESHTDLKQEQYYEEDRKTNVAQVHQEENEEESSQQIEEQVVQNEQTEQKEVDQENQDESLEENTTTNPKDNEENAQENPHEALVDNQEVQNLQPNTEDKNDSQDNVDGRPKVFEEPMEIDDQEQALAADDKYQSGLAEKPAEEEIQQNLDQSRGTPPEKVAASEEEGEDVPPEVGRKPESLTETLVMNDPTVLIITTDDEPVHQTNEEADNIENDPSEPMEVDGKAKEQEQQDKEADVREDDERVVEEQRNEDSADQMPRETENEKGDINLPVEPQMHQEEMSESPSEFQHQSETSNSRSNYEDDNSQSSQENAQNDRNDSSINQTILDDWEDTDSQQSDKQRTAMKEAAENVTKLMDDWEEEEEEDKREHN